MTSDRKGRYLFSNCENYYSTSKDMFKMRKKNRLRCLPAHSLLHDCNSYKNLPGMPPEFYNCIQYQVKFVFTACQIAPVLKLCVKTPCFRL